MFRSRETSRWAGKGLLHSGIVVTRRRRLSTAARRSNRRFYREHMTPREISFARLFQLLSSLPAPQREPLEAELLAVQAQVKATLKDFDLVSQSQAEAIVRSTQIMEELEEAQQKAECASETKSAFLANMSHEIRTPMHGVIGTIRLLLDSGLEPRQRRLAEAARSSADILLALLNDILDFSKIESGKLELELVECELQPVVEDLMNGFTPLAIDKGLCLETRFAPSLPQTVLVDPLRIRQVLGNLLGNAIKFTESGTICVRASCASGDKLGENAIEISVQDTGCGISPDNLSRLFESFSQEDSSISRRFGGSGLGLAIAKSLVELMGGRISVSSQVGEGSVFSVVIPATLLPAQSARTSPPLTDQRLDHNEIDQTAFGTTDDSRVLLVEDQEINRLVTVEVLAAAGIECDAVDSGAAALEKLTAETYDLVLMDCQMPGVNGFDTTREIRRRESADPDAVAIPIIAITASAMKSDREECLRAGMDDYMTKPFDPNHLIALVRRYLVRTCTDA